MYIDFAYKDEEIHIFSIEKKKKKKVGKNKTW